MSKKIILSGVKPTNVLTIGNYFGALKNWTKLQKDYVCFFPAVDLHSITVKVNPKDFKQQTYNVIASYIAAGIDPDHCTLFLQSQVPAHAELTWILNCFSYMGELNRMTQFKDKSARAGTTIPTGLFTYPVLMAADILLYQANLVPVGQDQKQHIELTRDIALRMNNLYGDDLFTIPEPYIGSVGAKIMDLQNPESKMGKSDSADTGAVYLSDSDNEILKKVKRAVTDSGSEIKGTEDQPGIRNLLTIQSSITGLSQSELIKQYAGKQYGHLKVETAELLVEEIRPVRETINKLLNNINYLDAILTKGAEKASQAAQVTLEKVYERIGFVRSKKV